MPRTNEAFSRVKIDAQLKDQGWDARFTISHELGHGRESVASVYLGR